jgi:hypothetical protein
LISCKKKKKKKNYQNNWNDIKEDMK